MKKINQWTFPVPLIPSSKVKGYNKIFLNNKLEIFYIIQVNQNDSIYAIPEGKFRLKNNVRYFLEV